MRSLRAGLAVVAAAAVVLAGQLVERPADEPRLAPFRPPIQV